MFSLCHPCWPARCNEEMVDLVQGIRGVSLNCKQTPNGLQLHLISCMVEIPGAQLAGGLTRGNCGAIFPETKLCCEYTEVTISSLCPGHCPECGKQWEAGPYWRGIHLVIWGRVGT